MYDINPKAVYAHERVYTNPRAVKRMQRMLEAIGVAESDVPRVNNDDIDEIIRVAGLTEDLAALTEGGQGRIRQGHVKLAHDPVLVFNTFVWNVSDQTSSEREFRNPLAKRLQRLFCGVGANFAYSYRQLMTPRATHYVCQGGSGIHTLGGCLHKCDYCGQGFLVNLMIDLEDFCDHLPELFARQPEQLLYRYDLYSDILAFEPEYGASALFGRRFAEYGKYLLLYTRSDNVQYLAGLEERKHVLINWTISMETQARIIERDSPTLDERIEAMRFCQSNGYVVRAGFSPVIPIANWREETTDMLQRLFSQVEPEVLRAWVLAMMEASEFEAMFDTDMMDPWAVARMRESEEELRGMHMAPFPLDVREEIYRYYLDETAKINPETPFALCTENPALWPRLQDRLMMTRDAMFCCCGGVSVPGNSGTILGRDQ